jgi:hypothetical protein
MYGHLPGAGAAVELVTSLLSIRHKQVKIVHYGVAKNFFIPESFRDLSN